MSDDAIVLDASALLALLQNEPGADIVAAALPRSLMSAVNISEVVGKLIDKGMPAAAACAAIDGLPIEVQSFDRYAAYLGGELRSVTRGAGLSLGDRACLALAMRQGAEALTTDRAWSSLPQEKMRIVVIR